MSTERPSPQEELGDHRLVDLNTPQFDDAFARSELFSKVVQVYARQIKDDEDPEVIQTILLNGVQEASRPMADYQPGSWIVVNPGGGERYLVSPRKFDKRYEPIDAEVGLFRGIGLNRMVQNTTGGPVAIRPPWDPDEIMKGDENCWFSMVVDPDNPDVLSNDRYIIGDAEKEITYARAGLGYKEVDLLCEEITAYLREHGDVYQKTGYVFGRKMAPGEIVKFIRTVPDLGDLVLRHTYHPDKTLLTPHIGERYMVADTAMLARHQLVDKEFGLFRATGGALIAPNPHPDRAIKARAPWGETQHVPSTGSLAVAIDKIEGFDKANSSLPADRYLLDDTDVRAYQNS